MDIHFLYIVDDFPPAGMQPGIRALEISKRLVKEKIFPIILTKKIDKNKIFNKSLIKEIPSSLNIYRTPLFELKNKFLHLIDPFFKYDFYLQWIPFAYSKAKKILRENKNIKFIYASAPYFHTHIIGYLLKKKFNLPLVIEYRDPWSFNPYHEKIESWLNKKINLIIEKRILKSADIIITVSSELNSFLKTKFSFIQNKPIFSIANGLNVDKFYNYPKKNYKEIIFTFTGALYEKRSIVPLIKLIFEIKKENFFRDFRFSMRIFGNYKKEPLKYIIKKLNIEDSIILGDLIPRSEALNEIIKSDLAIHIGENLNYPTIAFKVWDYLSCRKKILYLGREDSYTANFLKKNEFGIVIPINNLPKGKKILKRLLNEIKNNKFDNIIKEKKLAKFSWDNRAKKFINRIIKTIVPTY